MLRYAIVSDIHSNIEALCATMDDIEFLQADEILCLGDLLGYGANPKEVADITMQEFKWVVRGNHDDAITYKLPKDFNPAAAAAVFWTREMLKPGEYSGRQARRRWHFLRHELKRPILKGGVIFAHGTPSSYLEYIDGINAAKRVFEKLHEGVHTLFVGHTHLPGVFIETKKGIVYLKSTTNDLPRMGKSRMIINVGSVGQPRDGDPRACYVIVEGDRFAYRRVEYDIQAAANAIYSRHELPNKAGNRLLIGR